MPKALWIVVGIAPVIGLFCLLVWGISRPETHPGSLAVFDRSGEVEINRRDPIEFTVDLLDGTKIDATDFRGEWLMVDFWASWCPPCRAEADTLESVWRKYKGKGVRFLGVDIWDRLDRAREFTAKHGTTYPVGVDPKGELVVEFGVTGIPEKYFLDPQGVIVRKFVGPMNESRLSRTLDELLTSEQ